MRCAVPSGFGARPVAQYSVVSHTDSASAASNSEASMCWPAPVRSRATSAAEDRRPREQARAEVGDRHAALHRLAARFARDAHHARHGLRDQVEAGPSAYGPVWPKPEMLA